MCEFCVKHGEGKKWYLNAKNYSDDLLSDLERRRFVKDHFFWIDKEYKRYFQLLKNLPYKFPLIGATLKAITRGIFVNKHWCQIIPIEDTEKIFEFTNSITRVPCICRKLITGKEVRSCFLVSLDPAKLGIGNLIDRSYFGGPDVAKFETVTKEWTINFIQQSQKAGMVTTVFAIMAPFVGIICNCDYESGCIPMRLTKDATPFMFRGEYVARINSDLCIGCKKCVSICQFDALELNNKSEKASVNLEKCYGCGVCRTVCTKGAILLIDRASEQSVSTLW